MSPSGGASTCWYVRGLALCLILPAAAALHKDQKTCLLRRWPVLSKGAGLGTAAPHLRLAAVGALNQLPGAASMQAPLQRRRVCVSLRFRLAASSRVVCSRQQQRCSTAHEPRDTAAPNQPPALHPPCRRCCDRQSQRPPAAGRRGGAPPWPRPLVNGPREQRAHCAARSALFWLIDRLPRSRPLLLRDGS